MTTSAVYEGRVAHRRAGMVPHSFGYRVFMPLFDLEELPGLLDAIPLWSARRPAPARFRDGDYLPGDGDSLAERARNLVDARLGRRPAGPVRLLANPRYLGVGFNPVSFLFLHTPDGGLDSVIAEVTNTPWGERTAYVLDWDGHAGDEPITCSFEKGMHVSPFQSMEQTYEISVTRPGQRLGVVIRNHEGGREVFVASMALRRSEVTRIRMLRLLLRYPPMTVATLARIYVNALRLKLRGAPFHSHPEVRDEQALRESEQARSRTRSSGPRTTRALFREPLASSGPDPLATLVHIAGGGRPLDPPRSTPSPGPLTRTNDCCKYPARRVEARRVVHPVWEGAKRISFSFEKEETRMRPVDDSNAGSRELAGKPLEIKAHREGDSISIALSGEMDLSTVGKLDAAIRNAEDTVIGQIVVDMTDLSFVDSTGLSVLLRASRRSREDGNRLSFVPSKHEAVTRLVALTGTSEMFD